MGHTQHFLGVNLTGFFDTRQSVRHISELLVLMLGPGITLQSHSSTNPTAALVCPGWDIISVNLAGTPERWWLCHDHVLLENPSSQMDTCAHKAGSKKEGDVTELCINSRTCTAKNGWPLFLLHLTGPPRSFAPAPFNTLPTRPCGAEKWLLPPEWTLGSLSSGVRAPPGSRVPNASELQRMEAWTHKSLLTILGYEKRAGRASTVSHSGLQNGLPRAGSRGADGHVQGQAHRDWAQDACPGLRLCSALAVHSGRGSLSQAVPPSLGHWQKR